MSEEWPVVSGQWPGSWRAVRTLRLNMNTNRPPRDIHQAIVEACDRREPFAVATVMRAKGSTPVKAGAKAIIHGDGRIQGTVGGGSGEAEARRRAMEAMGAGRPLVFDFHMEGDDVDSRDPICGGSMLLLVDPTAADHRAAYAEAAAARQRRERGVLVTTVRGQYHPAVEVRFVAEEAISSQHGFPDAETLRAVLDREESKLLVERSLEEHERLAVLAEPLVPYPLLVIFGGGHVGRALAVQASLVGFDVVVIDDRPEFTAPELFPEGVATRCGPMVEELDRLSVGKDAYLVIVTRGHRNDAEVLAACVKKRPAYVGMIGSRRKVGLMRKEFLESGFATAQEFDRVYTPIGLDIGAATVPEIAASITAQLIAVRRKGAAPRIPSP